MPLFTYTSRNKDGVVHESSMEAEDRFVVYKKINADGEKLVSLKEKKKRGPLLKTNITFFTSIKTQEKITFAKNLSSMIEAGLPITRALAVMEKQAKNEKLRGVITSLISSISKGKTFSEALSSFPDTFSRLFISMVKAGEESGNIVGALKMVALQMEKSHSIVKKVRGAMIYPVIILIIMVIIGILMMVYMVPTLTATFKGLGVELPLSTRIIIAISDFLRFNFLIFSAGVLTMILVPILYFRSKSGRKVFHKMIIHIPIVGTIVKEVNVSRTARTLSSLMSSGVDIVVALGVTEEVLQNIHYKKVIEEARILVEKGDSMSKVFSKYENLFPAFVGEMMAVGEETGKTSDMLLNVALFYEEEVDQKTKDMSTIIEPVLMVFIGIAVGIFAISMLSPTYSLADKI